METPRPVDRNITITDVPWGYDEPEDDVVWATESLDFEDETAIRDLVDVATEVIRPDKPFRVTVLKTEWDNEVELRAKTQERSSLDRCFLDQDDPQHLLVSPACVEKVSRRDREAICEVLYTLARGACKNLPLSPPVREGLRDLIVAECGLIFDRTRLAGLANLNPEEARFVDALLTILVNEPRYRVTGLDGDEARLAWVRELMKRPDRFFLALRRSAFAECWLQRVDADQETGALIIDSDDLLMRLCLLLRYRRLTRHHPFYSVTEAAAFDYVDALARG